MLRTKHIILLAAALFIGSLWYFVEGVKFIPDSAGPDMAAHVDITEFISKHHRLPILPEDVDKIKMSGGGTTRATRPPFAYIVGALAAKIAPASFTPTDAYSLGSALLMALCLLVTFLTITLAFKRISYGLLAAALMGLMPQFGFIASYINDDSGAIFAGSLLTAGIVLLVKQWATQSSRQSLNVPIVAFIAIVCGITIMAKLSAWLMLPFIALAALLHLKNIGQHFIKYAVTFIPLFLIFGGWWLVWNMLHYGVDDPLMFKVSGTLIDQFDRNPDNNQLAFAAQGQTYWSLLVGNYMGFMDNTYQSSVGFLDTLKLRLGPVQYGFYLPIFLLGFIVYLCRLIPRLKFSSTSGALQDANQQDLMLETLLVALLAFQLLMYTRFNLYQDIQVQGKYLLPALPALIYLFIAGFEGLLKGSVKLFGVFTHSSPSFNLIASSVSAIIIFAAVVMHSQALLLHVIPFYRPAPVQLNIGPFKSLDLSHDNSIKDMRNASISVSNDQWTFNSPKGSAYIVMHPSICEHFGPSTLMRVILNSDHDDQLKIYYNNGLGHVEKHSGRTLYKTGESVITYSLKDSHCTHLRIDIMRKPGTVTISDIAFAPFTHLPKYH